MYMHLNILVRKTVKTLFIIVVMSNRKYFQYYYLLVFHSHRSFFPYIKSQNFFFQRLSWRKSFQSLQIILITLM